MKKTKYPTHSPSPTYSPSPSKEYYGSNSHSNSGSISTSPSAAPQTYMSYEQYTSTNQGRYKPYTSTILPDASYTSYANIDEGREECNKIYTIVKATVFIILLALIVTIAIVVAQGEQEVKKVEPMKIENTRPSAFDNKKSMFDN